MSESTSGVVPSASDEVSPFAGALSPSVLHVMVPARNSPWRSRKEPVRSDVDISVFSIPAPKSFFYLVQTKLTQRSSVALASCPVHLLIHKLHSDGTFEEIYNRPGEPVWAWWESRIQKNGQASISLSRLRGLMEQMDLELRLPEKS